MSAVWGRRLLGVALLSFVVVALLDAVFGADVTLLHTLHDEAARAEARTVFDERDDVALLYGRVEPSPHVRVIVFDRSQLITPPEAPQRRLLHVDRTAGETVLPARALWSRVAAVAGPLGLIGLVLLRRGRSRSRSA